MKKHFIALFAIMMAVVVLTGCGPIDQAGKAVNDAAVSVKDAVVNIIPGQKYHDEFQTNEGSNVTVDEQDDGSFIIVMTAGDAFVGNEYNWGGEEAVITEADAKIVLKMDNFDSKVKDYLINYL